MIKAWGETRRDVEKVRKEHEMRWKQSKSMIRGKHRVGESMRWDEYVKNKLDETRREEICIRRYEIIID